MNDQNSKMNLKIGLKLKLENHPNNSFIYVKFFSNY